jgi:hypothetical protein
MARHLKLMKALFNQIRNSFPRPRDRSSFRYTDYSIHHKAALGLAAAAALMLSGCIESKVPLLTDAPPLFGQEFQVHLYGDFIDGKANDFHASIYRWKDGHYVRAGGLARDIKSFVAQSMTGNDYLLQTTDASENTFNYWIGRKVADGVYLIFAVNEADVGDAARDAACAKSQSVEICQIQTFDQLKLFARATLEKPVRNPALGVILAR